MKYILFSPLVAMVCLHLATYFDYTPNGFLVALLTLPLFGCFVYSVSLITSLNCPNRPSVFKDWLGHIEARHFFLGLFLVIYFFFNFAILSKGGHTRIEGGKHFALKYNPRGYYEISEEEYLRRQLFRFRGISGHIVLFGAIGVFSVYALKFKSEPRSETQ